MEDALVPAPEPLRDLLAAVPDISTVNGNCIGDITKMFPMGAVKEKAGNVNFVMISYIRQLFLQGFPPAEIARQTGIPIETVCSKLNLIANASLGKVTRETQYLLRLEADAAVQQITDELMSKLNTGNLNCQELIAVAKEAQNAIKLRTILWGLKSSEKDPPQKSVPAVAPPHTPAVINNTAIQNNTIVGTDAVGAMAQQRGLDKHTASKVADDIVAV